MLYHRIRVTDIPVMIKIGFLGKNKRLQLLKEKILLYNTKKDADL